MEERISPQTEFMQGAAGDEEFRAAQEGGGTGGRSAGALLNVLVRKWYLAAAVALVICVIALPVIWLGLAPKYVATSAIQISPVVQSVLYNEEGGTMPFYSDYVNTQAALIMSNLVVLPVLEDPAVRALPQYKEWKDPVQILHDNLTATVNRTSEFIEVTMTYPDPKVAAEIANATVRVYMNIQGGSEASSENEKLRVLEAQRDQASAQLVALSDSMTKLGEEFGSIDLASREQVMLARIQGLQDELVRAENDRLDLETQSRLFQEKDSLAPGDLVKLKNDFINTDSFVASWTTLLADLQKQFAEATLKYKTASDEIDNQRKAIDTVSMSLAAAQRQAGERFDDIMGKELARKKKEIVDDIDARIEQASAHEKRISDLIVLENADIVALGRKGLAIKSLQDQWNLKNDQYKLIMQRITAREVERNRPDQTSVAYTAEVPKRPDVDKRGKYSVVLILVAVLFGCAFTIALEEMAPRLETPGDVESRCPGLFVLGTTPKFRDVESGKVEPRHFIDDCRTIRINMLMSDRTKGTHVRAVVSPRSGDGKTSVAINVATSMSLVGKRVLLIDADLRKPDVARFLGLDAELGLIDVLLRKATLEQAAQKTSISTLDILPTKMSSIRTNESVISMTMNELMREVREKYDEVIIDTPAALALPDAKLWASMADSLLLVAGSGRTGVRELLVTQSRMMHTGTRVLGLVLTSVKPKEGYEKYLHRYAKEEEPLSDQEWQAMKMFYMGQRARREPAEETAAQ